MPKMPLAEGARYCCHLCNKTFTQIQQFADHVDAHEKSHPCHVCLKSFSITEDINQNIQQVHPHYSDAPEVPSKANDVQELIDGTETDSEANVSKQSATRIFKCSFCDKNLFNQYRLSIHEKGHREGTHHKCDICSMAFVIPGELRRHMRSHSAYKPFKCLQCPKSFRRGYQLKTHGLIHTGERPYECSVCKKRFVQNAHLWTHMKYKHSNERPFVCPVCGSSASYKFQSELRNHRKLKHSGVPLDHSKKCFIEKVRSLHYPCHVCDKTFTRSEDLVTHVHVHLVDEQSSHLVKDGPTPHCCDAEDAKFPETSIADEFLCVKSSSKEDTDNTSRVPPEPHVTVSKNFKRHFVEKPIMRPPAKDIKLLLLQIRSHARTCTCISSPLNEGKTEEPDVKYQNNSQDASTGDGNELSRSIMNASGNTSAVLKTEESNLILEKSPDKELVCVICSDKFQQASSLTRHLQTHTEESPEKGCSSAQSDSDAHGCKICGEQFQNAHSLVSHYVMHESTTFPHECHLCLLIFNDAPSFNQHCLISCLQCDVCNKICTSSRHDLAMHMSHHLSKGSPSYLCEICGKLFKKGKQGFNMHMKIHEGLKQHSCENCGMKFRQIPHLSAHMLTHTGEKPHVCHVCGRAFALKGNLTAHIKTHKSTDDTK